MIVYDKLCTTFNLELEDAIQWTIVYANEEYFDDDTTHDEDINLEYVATTTTATDTSVKIYHAPTLDEDGRKHFYFVPSE